MKAFIGISIDAKSTNGSSAVVAVLLGTWYQEINLDAVFAEIVKDLHPEHFPSLKDPEIGDMLLSRWPFLDEVQKWMNTNPVGVYMKDLGQVCNFSASSPNASIRHQYGYGSWNDKIYNRIKMDLAVLLKKTDWFIKNRPDIEAALKKTRVVAKVMTS